MEYTEKEFNSIKAVAYFSTTIVELALGCACVSSNMRTVPKLLVTTLCIEQARRSIVSCLKTFKINGEPLKVK